MTNDQQLRTHAFSRTRRRILLGATAGVLAGLVGLGAVGAASGATTPAPTPGSSSLLQGAYVGAANPSAVTAFDGATGTHASIATDYLPGNAGFAGMDGSGGSLNWLLGPYQGSGLTLSLGVPIIPTDSSGSPVATLATGATGFYNSAYVTLAQTLVAAGQGNTFLRLGWEFDGGWMPWNATTPSAEAAYASYFVQIVKSMRSVAGASFRFVWNPDAGAFTQSGYNVALAYPGSAYVNVIGLDAYDQTWVSPQTPTNAWNQTTMPTLVAAQKFASAQAQPLAFPEWGVSIRSDGHGLGDDPLFISNMVSWMKSPTNNVAFEAYFDANSGGVNSDLTGGGFPHALAAFGSSLGSSAPTTTVPVAAPAPPPVVVVIPLVAPTPTAPASSTTKPPAVVAPVTTPAPAATSKPAGVTALAATVSGTSVALRWSNPTGATGDSIYLNGNLRTTVAAGAVSYNDTNAPSGWHTYNVSASNSAGLGAQSNSVTVFIQAMPATPATTTQASAAVTALTASVQGTTVTLTWTNPSGARSNHIYYNGVLRTTLTSTATGYTDVSPPSGWHTYNVTANTAAGEGPISNSVTVYIP